MEINKGQIINFQTITSARVPEPAEIPQGTSLATIRNSRIFTSSSDLGQWGRVAAIIDRLNWPVGILVRSAIERGDTVESVEVTAPLKDTEGKVGELIIGPDSVQLWQERGHVLITGRLPEQTAISSVNQHPNQPKEATDQTSNPYLQAPAVLKKAA
ncbi:hypothetical protein HYS96_03150 [Candidatus Daviesbacteria bacterium]|nr:hypothetical protein [Candidatus Daviesbacteria bacterium]